MKGLQVNASAGVPFLIKLEAAMEACVLEICLQHMSHFITCFIFCVYLDLCYTVMLAVKICFECEHLIM